MKSIRLAITVALVLMPLTGFAEQAPDFGSKVTDITVFKDGHALVMTRAKTEFENGWCRTQNIPIPLLGAFWAFINDPDARIQSLKSGFTEESTATPCMSLEDIIQANKGKDVVITDQFRSRFSGTLLGILEQKPVEDLPPAAGTPEPPKTLSAFVMVQSATGVSMINRSTVQNLFVEDTDPATTLEGTKKIRTLEIHAERKGAALNGSAETGLVYLQRGVRWIPDYRIRLDGKGKAALSLQATIINELMDFESARVNLVVGVPSFVMHGSLSPMALRDSPPQLGPYFPQLGGSPTSQRDMLSNVMMSQSMPRAGIREMESAVVPEAETPQQGQQEDLFLYEQSDLSLKKGERALVNLLVADATYEDIYTWDVSATPPMEMWHQIGGDQRELLESLTAPKAVHKVRLANEGNQPWTTGTATLFRESTPLGQQILMYTSAGGTVDVPVTVATDIKTEKTETEANRELNALTLNGYSWARVRLKGTLIARNFKDKPARLLTKRLLIGKATSADHDGVIRLSNAPEDQAFSTRGSSRSYNWPHWWWGVNSTSEIKWDTTLEPDQSVTYTYEWEYFVRQ